MSKHTTVEQLKKLAERTKTELTALEGKIGDYGLVKQETAENGYLATYQLTKNGTPTGDKINIPKDLLVKSASVKEVTEADQPYEGAEVGDKYIDFVINSVEGDASESHVCLAVKDLGGSVTVDTATDAEIDSMLDEVFGAAQTEEEPSEGDDP